MPNVRAVLVAALLFGGCYQSFGGPSLDDAPLEVRERTELPSCGRTVGGYVGVSSDEGALDCFWSAYEQGEPAEYQRFFYSDAPESVLILRHEPDGEIRMYLYDGAEGWTRVVCAGLMSVGRDEAWLDSGPGFTPVGCTEEMLH